MAQIPHHPTFPQPEPVPSPPPVSTPSLLERGLESLERGDPQRALEPLRQAAYLFQGLLMNHGFLQGNKRTAYAMLEWFLAINRLGEIAAADDDVVRFCSEAENHQWSIDDIEDWLRANIAPRT